jgi:hypothetical protein
LQQVISCDDGDADASGEAVNDVAFSLVGAVRGHFTVRARYNIASPTRVAITYSDSTLEPQQLQAIFGDQMPLLLSIFNPEGWCVCVLAPALTCARLVTHIFVILAALGWTSHTSTTLFGSVATTRATHLCLRG